MNDLLDRLAERSITQVTGRSAEIGDCLVWTGSRDRKGYGWIAVARKAHRVAWIARHGQPPPETPCILHRCDNPPCWLDDHLFPGSLTANNLDMRIKGRSAGWDPGRTHCRNFHEYTERNTYWTATGRRICRTCKRLSNRRTSELRKGIR